MKLSHNKKRNTAFTYEVLIKELSKATMLSEDNRKDKILNILKGYFAKNAPLRRELEIYNSFKNLEECEEKTVEKVLFEARAQAKKLDKKEIFENQTKIINLINKELGQACWTNFVNDYKKFATINQVVFQDLPPKKQVFMEQKLVSALTSPKEEKKPFPSVNKLAVKTFTERFNGAYSNSLNESQKTLLNEYITSYKDDGSSLKMYLYTEVERLKESLSKHVESSPNVEKILAKVSSYNNKKIDRKFVTEVIKIQALAEELDNVS